MNNYQCICITINKDIKPSQITFSIVKATGIITGSAAEAIFSKIHIRTWSLAVVLVLRVISVFRMMVFVGNYIKYKLYKNYIVPIEYIEYIIIMIYNWIMIILILYLLNIIKYY